MLKTNFVQSLYTRSNTPRQYDGYLAFLPEGERQLFPVALASQRIFQTSDFVWIECKENGIDTPRSTTIEIGDYSLWLHLHFIGQGKLKLTESLLMSSGQAHCYHLNEGEPELLLDEGKSWFLILGVAGKHLDSLMVDYPKLKELMADGNQRPQSYLGYTPIQSKLYNVLESLRRFEFRSFGTAFQLANWNLRLFQQLFQDLKPNQQPAGDHSDSLLYQKAVMYIRRHYDDEDMSVAKIAEAMNVSPRKLSRSFQGKSFTVVGMILEYRLMDAREYLIHSDDSLAGIAFALNFACPKHFARAFKKRFGIGPNEFRAQRRKKESFVKRSYPQS
ncbi:MULTISPECIES: AraC family transcriptional regulator [Sphingobacterium]|uniref:AraC family transcriptional regulator n=1 Tax=Sphingobacterium TaxID=28453 RepID=UPI00257B9360|nr:MULTISPECIES: AraC family transcriptional regulator [Sphingobacterium]